MKNLILMKTGFICPTLIGLIGLKFLLTAYLAKNCYLTSNYQTWRLK